MGKAKIISGGTDGRYTIQILAHKTKAEARIDSLEEEIEKLRSGEDVEFDPSLLSQYNTLISLIDDYRDAIEDNRNKENDQKELTNEIALEQQQLETLQDDLSGLESTRDEYLTDYEEAEYSWEHGEITEDEYLFYQSRYLTAQANVVAKLASIAGQQAIVDALNAEKSAIKFAELDNDLETIKKKSGVFFEYDAKEPVDQLDTHVGYGETIVSHMAQAFNASIEWYNDAEQQNYQDAMDKAEWTEEQYPISVQMNEAYTEAGAAKTTRDSAQQDYDEAYVAYIRGDGTEEEMQAAADALSLAQANYSAKLAQYNVYYGQWEALEVQINGCVKIDTATMKTRLDNTNTEYTVMSQDLASLTAFRDRQELKATSMEKELERLQDELDKAERTIDAWCADLTEDLEADTEVGTIEISGEPDTILVHPGYDGAAVYDQTRDGQLQPPAISTAAQAFYNYALLPGWQKWQPTYRVGEITELDGNTCTVALDAATSVAQALNVNQAESLSGVTIEYMNCHGAAFEVGDRVVVEFTEQDWSQPKVIGFEEEPKGCEFAIKIIRDDGVTLNPTDHDLEIEIVFGSDAVTTYLDSDDGDPHYYDPATGYFHLIPSEGDEPDPGGEYFIVISADDTATTIYPRQFGRQIGGGRDHYYRDQDKVRPGSYTMYVPYFSIQTDYDPEMVSAYDVPPADYGYARYRESSTIYHHFLAPPVQHRITVKSSVAYSLNYSTVSRSMSAGYGGNRPSDGAYVWGYGSPVDYVLQLTVDGIYGQWLSNYLGWQGIAIGERLTVATPYSQTFYGFAISGVEHNATFAYIGPDAGTMWDEGQWPWVEFATQFENIKIYANASTGDTMQSMLGAWTSEPVYIE